jgi:excisionase family DNA binding protein
MYRPPKSPPPEVLDTHDAAELLRVSTKTLLRLTANGEIPANRVGKQWRFSRAALVAHLAGTATTRTEEMTAVACTRCNRLATHLSEGSQPQCEYCRGCDG